MPTLHGDTITYRFYRTNGSEITVGPIDTGPTPAAPQRGAKWSEIREALMAKRLELRQLTQLAPFPVSCATYRNQADGITVAISVIAHILGRNANATTTQTQTAGGATDPDPAASA